MPDKAKKNKDIIYCSWCGNPTTVIWVHGHGQCAICGLNIDECCKGEICTPKSPEPDAGKND